MQDVCCPVNLIELSYYYDCFIFEGGQGLALDENNTEEYPHVTASSTGSCIPIQRVVEMCEITKQKYDVEICYVTRSYLTRHGEGKLSGECKKEDINASITDQTNMPNAWQGTMRFARLLFEDFLIRYCKDKFHTFNQIESCIVGRFINIKTTCMITHLNYICNMSTQTYEKIIKEYMLHFHHIYLSDSPCIESVKIHF